MTYYSRSIDNRTVANIGRDFMKKRMTYQHLSVKYKLPIRDIKFHLSKQLEVPEESLISMRSLKRKADNSKQRVTPSKTIRMVIDVLSYRLELLNNTEPLESKTLQEIGDDHGVTKQRVEQIELAIKKYLFIKELEMSGDK